jgi:serine/threonine protein phosphatase PrpC
LNLVLHTPDWILRLDDEESAEEVKRRAAERYQQVNELLTQQAEGDARLRGFGTTMTLARSLGRDLLVVNVGDSRAYLLRRGRLHQITRDHTVAQSLAERGLISPTEVASHRLRHMVTELLGHHGRHVRPDIQSLVLADNDCLLLCTDGLTDMVKDQAIAETLGTAAPAEHCCHRLVEQALSAGGRDNITVVVARYQFPETTTPPQA